MYKISMKTILDGVIAKGAGSVLFGGEKLRGPVATAEFIYECMIGVAIELTNQLPLMFEGERQKYHKDQLYYREFGNKGKYTDSYGWDKERVNKMDFSFDPVFFNYFNRIIVPFLGGQKKGWVDENSKIWKMIKKMIIDGDKDKIRKLQQSIMRRILKESKKDILKVGGYGSDGKDTGKSRIIE